MRGEAVRDIVVETEAERRRSILFERRSFAGTRTSGETGMEGEGSPVMRGQSPIKDRFNDSVC